MSNSKSSTEENDPQDNHIHQLIDSISIVLKDIIEENTNDKAFVISDSQKKMSFNSKRPPSISIMNYLNRIIKYTNIEDSTLIISLIYIDRICENKNIFLTEFNIHRQNFFINILEFYLVVYLRQSNIMKMTSTLMGFTQKLLEFHCKS
jgi:hypothetical protein